MASDAPPPSGADEWMAAVQRTLRGRDLAELSSSTRDGIEIHPLYTDGPGRPAPLAAPDPQRSANGWDVRQHHWLDPLAADSDEALAGLRCSIEADLAGGATSVELAVPAAGIDGLGAALAGVDLSVTPVALAPHCDLAAAEALLTLAGGPGGLAAGSSLGIDPLGEWVRSGLAGDCGATAAWLAGVVEADAARGAPGPGVRAFAVDSVRYSDTGATEAQALGWATATGVAYLRALVDAGFGVDAAANLIAFRTAATADTFTTIAALRAARVMWARAVTASGGSQDAARQYQHAVTAAHTYSRSDRWANLLRGASAALAAGLGGADAVTVLPFDHACTGEGSDADADGELGRRLARNTQLLLLQESHLARAADPAGGSFYVESLTEELAAEGWRLLQDVERCGGIEAALADGTVAEALERSR